MATILVTNDDGVYSPGLLVLKQALADLGTVIVLAPERNWSASSHAKTMHKPLRVNSVMLADGSEAHMASGSPTDCVALAADGVLGAMPDLVVSGINSGHNLAIDITYSGTVACAMEATILGVPGIAVSAPGPNQVGVDALMPILEATGRVARTVAAAVLAQGLPNATLLNLNTPSLPPAQWRGLQVTRMGHRHYPLGELVERQDPGGKPYYWLGGTGPVDRHDDGTDVGAVNAGYVSVTPVSLDLTDQAFLPKLADWSLAIDASITAPDIASAQKSGNESGNKSVAQTAQQASGV
ncbi:MAG: 5'/3'-nucleotidase SurE [Litorilinea sp.]